MTVLYIIYIYTNFPYYYRLMAIWVQNVENTGFVPEAPVSDCRQRTVQTAFGLFSTLPCRRQCDHSRGCSSKCELGLSVPRGRTLPPLPPLENTDFVYQNL